MAIPTLIGFDSSFAGWDAHPRARAYTGYVAEPDRRSRAGDAGKDEVVVSVGGGAVGAPLLRAAPARPAATALAGRTWRLLGRRRRRATRPRPATD